MFREPIWAREMGSRPALESGLGADFYEFAQSPQLRGRVGQKEKEPLIACDKDSPLRLVGCRANQTRFASYSNFTETIFETPGSCIVTP